VDRIVGANWIYDAYGKRIFTNGPPATTVPAEWLTGMQEEIMSVIESRNIVPSSLSNTQLLTAIRDIAFNSYFYGIDSGVANAYSILSIYGLRSYNSGLPVIFKATNNNTGSSTININNLGVVTIKKYGDIDLMSGDISSNATSFLLFDGTYFQLLNPSTKKYFESIIGVGGVTSLSISGLNGAAHGGYIYEIILKNGYAGNTVFSIYFNGNVTATDYYSNWTGTAIANAPYLYAGTAPGPIGTGESLVLSGNIIQTSQGLVRFHGLGSRFNSSDILNLHTASFIAKTTAVSGSNLTDMSIVSDQALGIEEYSSIKLWLKG
jgi:hypothetical protein